MYVTIRQAARLPEVPFAEYTLRKMNRDGKIPGVYAGKKFLINLDLFLQEINERCAEK